MKKTYLLVFILLAAMVPFTAAETVERTEQAYILTYLIGNWNLPYLRWDSDWHCTHRDWFGNCLQKWRVKYSWGFQVPKLFVPINFTLSYDSDDAYPGNTFLADVTVHTFDHVPEYEFEFHGGSSITPMFKINLALGWYEDTFNAIDGAIDIQDDFRPPLGTDYHHSEDTAVAFTTSYLDPTFGLLSILFESGTTQGGKFEFEPQGSNWIKVLGDFTSSDSRAYLRQRSGEWDYQYSNHQVNVTLASNTYKGQKFYLYLDDIRYYFYTTYTLTMGIFVDVLNQHFEHTAPVISAGPFLYIRGDEFLALGPMEVSQQTADDIYPSDIYLSKNRPTDGEEIRLIAVVKNHDSSTQNIEVDIYDNGVKKGPTQTVRINPQGTGSVDYTYNIQPNGWHNLSVVVDPAGKITENEEGNNRMWRMAYVKTKPDLIVTKIGVEPKHADEIRQADKNKVYATFENIGETRSFDSKACFYDKGNYIGKYFVPQLDPGEDYEKMLTSDWIPWSDKWHNVTIVADCRQHVEEHNENNNALSDLTVWVNTIPEMYVYDIRYSVSGLTEGNGYYIYTRIINIQNRSAADFHNRIVDKQHGKYFHNYFNSKVTKTSLIEDYYMSFLDKHGFEQFDVQWSIPKDYGAGQHTTRVQIDLNNTVFEYHEDNNIDSISTYVRDFSKIGFYPGWNYITLPSMPHANYASNPNWTAQYLGDYLDNELADHYVLLIQRWNTSLDMWETHVVQSASGQPVTVQPLIDAGYKPDFTIETGIGYRVYVSGPEYSDEVAFWGYLIENPPDPGFYIADWNSRGWYPDQITHAGEILKYSKGIAGNKNGLVVARWDRMRQAWQFYFNATIPTPLGNVNVNPMKLGNFPIYKGEGYMVFVSDLLALMLTPYANQVSTNAPEITFTASDEIKVTAGGTWVNITDPDTPNHFDPALISIHEHNLSEWNITVDWNNFFDVLVEKTSTDLTITTPSASNARPDLEVASISFSDSNPKNRHYVTISANISNLGGNTSYNITVDFFRDDPSTCEGECYLETLTLNELLAGSSTILDVNWTAEEGEHNIHVIATSLESVERFTDNNLLIEPITVDPRLIVPVNVSVNSDWDIKYESHLSHDVVGMGVYNLPYEFEMVDSFFDITYNIGTWEEKVHPEGLSVYAGMLDNQTGDLSLNLSLHISDKVKPGTYNVTIIERTRTGYYGFRRVSLNVEQAGSSEPPEAFIDTITPGQPTEGDLVSFTGHGTDALGINGYRWTSSLDGLLGTSSLVATTLSAGNHLIIFKVRDNTGTWSAAATDTLQVNERPTATITTVTPAAVQLWNDVYFDGSGSDDDRVLAYKWESDVDGLLSSKKTFTTPYLSNATHIISFYVRDTWGAWSLPVTTSVDVFETTLPTTTTTTTTNPTTTTTTTTQPTTTTTTTTIPGGDGGSEGSSSPIFVNKKEIRRDNDCVFPLCLPL